VREGAEVNEPQSSNPATSIALKPCPFCDGVAELDTCQPYLALGTGKLGKAVAVYCTTCSAHMTECVEDHRDVPREDVTTYVVGLWNARKQPDETPVLYTKAEAETLCAIAAAGVQHVSALDAARYRWLKDRWYDAPLFGHTDASDIDAIIDSQLADEAIEAEQPATTGEKK
jgi:hypothetical protein